MINTAILAMTLICLFTSLQCTLDLLPVQNDIEICSIKWSESEEGSEHFTGKHILYNNISSLYYTHAMAMAFHSGFLQIHDIMMESRSVSPESPPPDSSMQ